MVDRFVVDLHLPLSQIRLERYRGKDARGVGIGTNLDMLVDYFWNIALAESLYPTLHAVEIALRNTVHTTLTNRYQSQRWWHDKSIRMISTQYKHITDAEAKYFNKYQAPITPGKLVSELNFGFWTTIMSGPYESRIWRWRQYQLVSDAFPHAGQSFPLLVGAPFLHRIYQRFNDIRIYFHNRVMHYDAIYDRPNLLQEHLNIHEAIGWISPELLRGVHAVDRFRDVYDHGRAHIYNKLQEQLGGP